MGSKKLTAVLLATALGISTAPINMFLKQIFLIRLLQAQTTVIIFMRILTGPIVSLGQFLWIAKIQKAF